MNFETVEKIANAVLYEGYMLYPYRPTSTKNRQRWNFGTLYPQAFSVAQQPPESFRLSAECVVKVVPDTKLDVRVRFLQIGREPPDEEDAERTVDLKQVEIGKLAAETRTEELSFQTTKSLHGRLAITATEVQLRLIKLHVELTNVTAADRGQTREAVLPLSFSSAHLLLGISDGVFISLLDPPRECQAAVADCHNVGVFPVLAGEEGQQDIMLCSPIILYDYPKVAAESAGDFFDGTEMDEMLSLRVLTLTEEEKKEIRQADRRTRDILERTESLPAEHLMKLHGAIRGLRRVQQGEEKS